MSDGQPSFTVRPYLPEDRDAVLALAPRLAEGVAAWRDAYVGELVVSSEAERTGVGSALMAAAESWARAHGLCRMTLETGAANLRARAFYRSLGFADEDVRLSKPIPATNHGPAAP
ncbi:GNAT family N-acetyltransferase [Streptosporangium algeriense]|uniref:GNAT family N-acetyltransferase n=1 Tax=Streptosporangium algeriense TaxID=1682748 RepID=A0ABW3DNP3_9ACTN